MAITIRSTTTDDTSTFQVVSPVVTASISVTADDIIVHGAVWPEVNPAGNLSVSNSGSALTWNLIVDTGNGAFTNGRVAGWWAKATTTESITISTAWDSGNNHQVETYTIVHVGAHLTDPCPAAKVYSGTSASSVSQSITPSASGSALYMLIMQAADTSTFAAGTDCTKVDVTNAPDNHSVCLIRPTTQPRTDANAFTLAETHTGSDATWIAFEVQSGGGGGGVSTAWLTA